MSKHWCYFLFLLWFAYLITSSILLFMNGFLLTRVTQESNSTCASYSEITCLSGSETLSVNITNGHEYHCSNERRLSTVVEDINSASSICLPAKAKVILVIIDALRYDFTITVEASDKQSLPYHNKMPIINKLMQEYPQQSRLYKFIADPPTTTMQRLKAMTTGSLPTFIDAGSNFATPEINEDNIIDQLVRHNQSIVFMGDDTWTGLYPERFSRAYPFPSFNVKDLDTVDNGIMANLYPEINRADWNLLIAHFLGVDHCGHRYGPNHPEMTRKLTEMNDVIQNIVEKMDNDTMLFVMGDHGMTVTGDHGGGSEDEITAALFIHSKKPLLRFNELEEEESVKQVDIVPTLSTILGVPIPFSNLGAIILNALPITEASQQVSSWQVALFSLWANVQQIVDYIKEYSSTTHSFNEETLQKFYETYAVMNGKIHGIKNSEEFEIFAQEGAQFIKDLREMCEEVWVQFDSYSMSRGLLFLFLSQFFVYLIVDGIPSNRLPEIFRSSFLPVSYSAMFIALLASLTLYYYSIVDTLLYTIFFATCFISQFMLAILIVQNWELISLNWYDRSKKNRFVNFICRVMLAFNFFGLFSNSYVVEEAYVSLFCLVTVLFVIIYEMGNVYIKAGKPEKLFPIRWPKMKWFAIMLGTAVLVRFSMYFWRCREEQLWCFQNPHELNIASKGQTTKLQWTLTVICLALYVTVTKNWLRDCGNLNGFSFTVTLAKYIPTVLVVCNAGYWVLNRLPSETKNKLIKPWQANILAWTVYALFSLGMFSVIWKPMCIYFKPKPTEISVDSNRSVVPQVFQQMREYFATKKKSDDISVVYGLGTVYSSTFIIIGVYVTLLLTLLLGDAEAPSAVIMFLTAAFVLIVTSMYRIEEAASIEYLLEIPNILLLAWVLISQYFFYGSGHQPTFPNIAWDAAFTGISGTFTSNYIPALLVIVNTFSSYILMGLLLPLLLIIPFTVFLMIPGSVSKRSALFKDSMQGEILLYERDSYMIATMFSVCCKYILCHGLRVFGGMLAATIHCRHLMVWKIFAPKLIFESIGMLVTLISVIFSFLILVRVNSKVDRLIVALNKQAS